MSHPGTGRLAVLIAGSSLAAVGFGVVLPFLYADVAEVRGLGDFAASSLFVWFSAGSLLAAPLAGRWADRYDPATVSMLARVATAAALLGLAFAGSTWSLWCAALLYGASGIVNWPAIQVLVLSWTREEQRRSVFAWEFISINLAIALGGVVGGVVIDLSSPAGTRPIYGIATAAELISAATVWIVARERAAGRRDVPRSRDRSDRFSARPPGRFQEMLRSPMLRLLVVTCFVLSMIFYGQYESGLPTFAYRGLDVEPRTVGTAIATNAVLVAVLTAPVVAFTRRRGPISLLLGCVALWATSWALLLGALVGWPPPAGALVSAYAVFAFGETLLSPVLTPLAASMAPVGATGRTLSVVSAARTLAGAVGPSLSGVLLANGVPAVFVGTQLGLCLVAALLLRRLRRRIPATVPPQADAPAAMYQTEPPGGETTP